MNIPTIYFAGVFVMMSTVMHFWYCLELQSSDKKKSVHQRALLYTRKKLFRAKMEKYKI